MPVASGFQVVQAINAPLQGSAADIIKVASRHLGEARKLGGQVRPEA